MGGWDLRNAANSLQIKGKGGCYLETHPIRGGDLAGGRQDHICIYIYIYIYIYICMYICTFHRYMKYVYIYMKYVYRYTFQNNPLGYITKSDQQTSGRFFRCSAGWRISPWSMLRCQDKDAMWTFSFLDGYWKTIGKP